MTARLEGVIDAYNNADPEAFAAAYTEDAWVLSMRRPIKGSRAEIKAAFRRLSHAHHPDRFQRLGPEAVEASTHRFLRIKQAYDALRS